MRSRSATAFLAAMVLMALLVPGLRPHAGIAASAPRKLGLHLNDADNNAAPRVAWKNALIRRQLGAHRRIDLVSTTLYSFGTALPSWREPFIIANGSTPVVNWATASTGSVANGSRDSTIVANANGLKSLGAPVILRFTPGMDTAAFAGTVSSAASFKSAWIHAHDVFVARGATNVEWAWCPSAAAWAAGTAINWYPGAAYVDWVCTQGANDTATWTSFRSLFQPFYTAASGMGKPLMVGSFGSIEKSSGMKGTWITNAFGRLVDAFPKITAAIYEDTGALSLSTSAPALSAWQTGVSQPGLYTPPVHVLPTGPLVPASGALLGINRVKQSPAPEKEGWRGREQASGRKLDFAHTFYYWGQDLTSWREPWHIQNGRISMMSWAPGDTAKINSGDYDTYIRASAAAVKNLGAKVFIRWFYEMDGDYNAAMVHSPTSFKAAWVRIHNLFDSVGATNAVWVWSPNAYGISVGAAQAYYPGDAYVDWLAGDGFNWYPTRPGSYDTSFGAIFTGFYAWASKQNKPVMIPVTGESEQSDPMGKANWLRDMGTAMEVLFPAVRALGYFDTVGNDAGHNGPYDRRLDTSPQSLEAWGDIAQRSYFAQHGSIG